MLLTMLSAAILAFAPLQAPAAETPQLRYEVRHDRLIGGAAGVLVFEDDGITYTQSGRQARHWAYQDIQRLTLAPRSVLLRTYDDVRWKLGADRQERFEITGEGSFKPAYEYLKNKLDQRFIAALSDDDVKPGWRLPVKLSGRFGGKQGVLVVGADRVVFTSDDEKEARTWRYSDIENVSTSGLFQLTIMTWEGASRFEDLKQFNFQLKAPLDEGRYDDLWRRVHQSRGLKILTRYTEGAMTASTN